MRLDFLRSIPGPVCGFCSKPQLVCYTNPCDGQLDHLSDIILRSLMEEAPKPQPKQKPVPLLKGGQGRRRSEVEAYTNTLALIVLAIVCVIIIAWGMQ